MKQISVSHHIVLIVAAILCPDGLLFAQTPASRTNAEIFAIQAERISFQTSTTHTFESDFTNRAAGSQSATLFESALTLPIRLNNSLRLQTGMSYSRAEFGGDSTPLLPGHMQGVAGIIGLEFLVKDQPAFYVRLSPGLYFIDDASGDSFDIPILLGGAWRFSESFIGLYGATYSGFRDIPILPAVGFLWNITDSIDFNLTFPTPNITWKINDNWRLAIEGTYRGISVHTAQDVDDPRFHDTELSYRELAAGLSTTYEFNEDTQLRFAVGWTFQRRFEYDNPETTFRAEGSPYLGISFRARF